MKAEKFIALLAATLDLGENTDVLAEEMVDAWSYDLTTRKPGPAYTEDGEFKGTDLDLATFLTGLVERKAVINLPVYKAQGARATRAGETVVSSENRHGKIVGLVSNADFFSFSVRIEDMNVMNLAKNEFSAFRTFSLVGYDGQWYDGWKSIDFVPDAKENAFLHDRHIVQDASVAFSHFVHPNRWSAFYGRSYLLAKVLQERLGLEQSYLMAETKRLAAAGFVHDKEPFTNVTEGEEVPKLFPAFNAIARHFADFNGAFEPYDTSMEGLDAVRERKRYVASLKQRLAFQTRVIEYAFYLHGRDKPVPSWAKDASWTTVKMDAKGNPSAKGKTEWQTITVQDGIELVYRTFDKTQNVKA